MPSRFPAIPSFDDSNSTEIRSSRATLRFPMQRSRSSCLKALCFAAISYAAPRGPVLLDSKAAFQTPQIAAPTTEEGTLSSRDFLSCLQSPL